MPHHNDDTIVAIATPPGYGGVGVVRISGKLVPDLIKKILKKNLKPRYATYCEFKNQAGQVLDLGIALYFKAPHSFTGEDILELQGHGGAIVLDDIVKTVIDLGARLAKPGEFSERAFLNDKIDLTQAEAIADLINSASSQAARSAINSLQGQFSEYINILDQEIINLRLYVEAAIDFPDEEIDFLADELVLTKIENIKKQLQATINKASIGSVLNEGMKVVICGAPNAGKSSLLNVISGDQVAIVSNIPGTTRDIVQQIIQIDGMPVKILDTAGLRESQDEIEKEGMRRTKQALKNADQILFVCDDSIKHETLDNEIFTILDEYKNKVTIVKNKIDLSHQSPKLVQENNQTVIYLSAKQAQGIELLKTHLKATMGYQTAGEGTFIARRRHLLALEKASLHIDLALQQLQEYHAGELIAEELKLAHYALAEITGLFTTDDLLGKIFSSFCIGK